MNTPSQIIDYFGGTSQVARMFDIAPASVSEWKKKGIPNARLMYLRLLRPEAFSGFERGETRHETASCTGSPS